MNENTKRLVEALSAELERAEGKYGFTDGWMRNDWYESMITEMHNHIQRNKVLGAIAYMAFAWHHQWDISPVVVRVETNAHARGFLEHAYQIQPEIEKLKADLAVERAEAERGRQEMVKESEKLFSLAQGLSNVFFNLSQPGFVITPEDRQRMQQAVRKIDAAAIAYKAEMAALAHRASRKRR